MSFASWEEALGALKQLPAGSKERADACAKVQGAAYWPKKRAEMIAQGAAGLLARVAREEAGDARLRACDALGYLASSDDLRGKVCAEGGGEAMITVAREEPPGSEARLCAVYALMWLAGELPEVDAATRELMDQLMREEKKGTPTRLYAEQALWKIGAPERRAAAEREAEAAIYRHPSQ